MLRSSLTRFTFIIIFFFAGCASLQEPFKVVWGSSTRALEKARADAIARSFQCTPQECFEAVVTLIERTSKVDRELARQAGGDTKTNTATSTEGEAFLSAARWSGMHIFLKDARRKAIVLLGVPGSGDTTEVGVFFTAAAEGASKVEISSLSKQAKARAAEIIFSGMKESFPVVDPAPIPATAGQPIP